MSLRTTVVDSCEDAGCYQPKNGLICHWPMTIPTPAQQQSQATMKIILDFDRRLLILRTYQSIDNPLSINGSGEGVPLETLIAATRQVPRCYRLINAWSLD